MANSQLSVTIKGRDELSQSVEQAKKSLQSLNTSGSRSLGQIADKFKQIESSSAPLKKQLREMQKLLADMNMGGLSNTALYTEIAQKAGKMKDAIADASTSVNRFANDTQNLKAAADAMSMVAAGASIATGAMGLLGMESEDVKNAILKVQSAMAILNGVQSIANALNKDSALLQKMKQIYLQAEAAAQTKAAAATAAKTTATKAGAIAEATQTTATAAQTVATNAQSTATKIATVAQYAWNTAIAANPIAATIAVIAAAAAAVLVYATRSTQAAEDAKALTDEFKNQSSAVAENRVRLQNLRGEWESLTNDSQRQEWIKTNASEFQKLGVAVGTVAEAESILVNNTDAFIEAMTLRAEAAAASALAQKEYQAALEKQEEAANRRGNPSRYDKIVGGLKVGWDFDFNKAINRQAAQSAGAYEAEARQHNERGDRFLKMAKDREERAKALENRYKFNRTTSQTTTSSTTTTRTGRGGGVRGGTTADKPLEGSINAINAEISDLETKLKNGLIKAGTEAADNAVKRIATLKKQAEALNIELGFAADPRKAAAEKFVKEAQKSVDAANESIKLQAEPDALTHQDRKDAINAILNPSTGLDATLEQWDKQADAIDKLNEKIKRQREIVANLTEGLKQAKAAQEQEASRENADRVIEITAVLKQQNEELVEMVENLHEATEAYNEMYDEAKREASAVRQTKKAAENFETYSEAVSNTGNAFSRLGELMKNVGDEGGAAFAQAFSSILSGAAEIAGQVEKLIELSRATTLAKEGEALASGAASAAKLPFPASLGAIASIVATLLGVFAQISSLKFAGGGIVGGTSFSGDRVHAMLNSGEMVLNGTQQSRLWAMVNGGTGNGREVTLRVKGTDLVGALNNYNHVTRKTRR